MKTKSNRRKAGVAKGEPRKKGILRFFEILSREYRDLIKVNLLFFLCILPSATLFFLGLIGIFELGLYLSVIAAFPVGGGVAASFFCITRMLRDGHGYIWDEFKRKFIENLQKSSIAGILATIFLYGQVFLFWLPIVMDWEIASATWIAVAVVLFLFFSMVAPYVFLHYAYIKLGTFVIVKNSILIALSNLGRSFMGALLGLLPWIALILFFPVSMALFPLIPFMLFVLSWLLMLMWVWPVFNRFFSVEETLVKEREEN